MQNTLLSVVLLSCLTGCQTLTHHPITEEIRKTRESDKNRKETWIKRNGLVLASSEEIAIAREGETKFVGNKASIPGQSLCVVFRKGTLRTVDGVGVHGLFTTTSSYELLNTRSGERLLKSASTIASGVLEQAFMSQKVIVSQDGKRLLIYETWGAGDGPHHTCALATKISDHGVWELEYLDLPEYDGFDGIPDRGPTPIGFSGDELIFDPLFSGVAYKKRISEIGRAGNPLPFTVG